jgi:hypothetical protein
MVGPTAASVAWSFDADDGVIFGQTAASGDS